MYTPIGAFGASNTAQNGFFRFIYRCFRCIGAYIGAVFRCTDAPISVHFGSVRCILTPKILATSVHRCINSGCFWHGHCLFNPRKSSCCWAFNRRWCCPKHLIALNNHVLFDQCGRCFFESAVVQPMSFGRIPPLVICGRHLDAI